ncbi:MAG: ComEC/Rec2 family competence protein [Pseudomonadota bacterium]|nr:ComEC/Rec2 family competence protein [Pseudomonadota bacterium]
MYHIARAVTRRLAGGIVALGGALANPVNALSALVEAERARLFLWAPVVLGAGIAAYFGLDFEPAPLPVAAALAVGLFAAVWLRDTALRLPAAALALVLAGLGLAVLRTALVAAPVLPAEVGPAMVAGTVEVRERLEDGERLTVRPDSIGALNAGDIPRRVRISIRTHGDSASVGDRVSVLAVLTPPSAPVEPGAFDFQRHAFYRGIGGYGYAVGPVRVEVPGDGIGLGALREQLTRSIRASLDGRSGPIAAALLTGDRSGIAEDDVQALRDSGLAHLLAISGLHMGLVAGFLFFAVRFGLALWPRVALRHPIRKWAACAALGGGLFYLLLTGGSVPTVRAFIMIALVMLAILTDRQAISLRTVAIAALAVLAMTPEAVAEPGFQMSFAAVVALVASYERFGDRLRPTGGRRDWSRRVGGYVAGVALTTLIAGIATAPYAIFHFNRVADYGLPANLAAIPLVAFVVMPAGTLAMVLVPLGLHDLPLWLMGQGIDLVLDVAHGVAGLPGAVRLVPAMPVWGLLATTLGGLVLCLTQGRRSVAGLLVIAAGMASPWLAERPVVRIDGEGGLLAVRAADGGLMLSSTRREKFIAGQWLARDGLDAPEPWPGRGASGDGRLRCDGLGCILRADGWMVALSLDPRAVTEDCQRADAVIATVPVPGRCPSARIVVDRFDLWRDGPHALWLARDGPVIRSVDAVRGTRPWVREPVPRSGQYWRNSATSRP